MFSNLYLLVRYFLFWLLFFFVERLIFVLFFLNKLAGVSVPEVIKAFFYGLWLDISTTGYLSVIPLLVYLAAWNFKGISVKKQLLCIYIRTFVVVCSLITVINLNIYREWGSKVNSRAFEFLFNSPGEAIASSISSPLLISFLILAFLIVFGFRVSYLFFSGTSLNQSGSVPLRILISVLLLGLNFLAIRGGWQLAPVNESMAYYSGSPILNHAAVNTEWSLFHSIKNRSRNKNPYTYFSKKEAEAIVKKLYADKSDSTLRVLTTDRPNIVLIIQESFTADVVESLGGEKGINPEMEKLIREGIFFTNIYASGDRTDRGIIAVLSGFPSQAIESIIKDNSKNSKLPSLYESLGQKSYYTSFYYGGESEFANMKSYFLSKGCENLVDKSDFDKKDMNSKWGAYDNVVYNKLLARSEHLSQPFFSTLLTLTNHEPFELPVAARFKGEDVPTKFKSTAFFADSCMGAFIEKAKSQPWYKNTLFIVVADHGHRLPKDKYEIYDSHRFRIPLLFFGDVIRPEYRGLKISKVGSQTDIAATLLAQMNISQGSYRWSENLLDPGLKGQAFFCWDNGFGFVNEENKLVSFDNVSRNIIYSTVQSKQDEQQLVKKGKAYLQSVFQQYSDY